MIFFFICMIMLFWNVNNVGKMFHIYQKRKKKHVEFQLSQILPYSENFIICILCIFPNFQKMLLYSKNAAFIHWWDKNRHLVSYINHISYLLDTYAFITSYLFMFMARSLLQIILKMTSLDKVTSLFTYNQIYLREW